MVVLALLVIYRLRKPGLLCTAAGEYLPDLLMQDLGNR
jgi:hypothetical protein